MNLFNATNSPLGMRIMRHLHPDQGNKTHTSIELSELCIANEYHVYRTMRLLKKVGLVRTVEWRPRKGVGGPPFAVYGYGYGLPDEKRPAALKTPILVISRSEVMQEVLDYIKERPRSTKEVGDFMGEGRVSRAYSILKDLKAQNLVHVKTWVRGEKRFYQRQYAYGPGEDAKKPLRMSDKEKKRVRRARLREMYGRSIAYKIIASRGEGGADQIVIDGQTVYRRKIDKTAKQA